jgi:hypothetical protein
MRTNYHTSSTKKNVLHCSKHDIHARGKEVWANRHSAKQDEGLTGDHASAPQDGPRGNITPSNKRASGEDRSSEHCMGSYRLSRCCRRATSPRNQSRSAPRDLQYTNGHFQEIPVQTLPIQPLGFSFAQPKVAFSVIIWQPLRMVHKHGHAFLSCSLGSVGFGIMPKPTANAEHNGKE